MDQPSVLSTSEAPWPPDLRPPPPPPTTGMDDSQFLGSIMGEGGPPPQLHHHHHPQPQPPPGVKRKRGRPPKTRDGPGPAALLPANGPPPKPSRRAQTQDDEEVVCFICFDGGNLVVCDRRGCPKVYHPACIKRDDSFFQSRTKWNCGWHICSSCEKAVHYMCYTCTYSVCKLCIKQGKFFSVRGTKGFCDTCFGTILLIESKDGSTKITVDFDDPNSWEYLFKLYWMDIKGKLSLTLEELTSAKSRWSVPSTHARKEKDESSDDLYDANNDDDDVGSDCSSGKRKRKNSSRKKARKRRKANPDCSIAAQKVEIATGAARCQLMKIPNEVVSLPPDTKWASPELLEFVGHMRNGNQSFLSQFDVQILLLDYIKQNNLRDPRRKSQIICDPRLHRLFRKARVAHFEMLKLLEMHFSVNEAPTVNNDNQGSASPNSAQKDVKGYSDVAATSCPDRNRMHIKMEREPDNNLQDYAAVDMHNINLIYLRRSFMEHLIEDAAFSDKIDGAFVRIRILGVGQKQDMYRLVQIIGTHKVLEKYSIGKKMTNFALEILNLDKKEIITMDTISNQDFTEEECKRLMQSMKCGLISRIKVGDIQEKARIFQSVRVNDWLEKEKQRLGHLRDRASETGRRKELRECVEKLQLLNTSEERTRRVTEVLEVHVDSHTDPDYESAEEMDDKNAVQQNVNCARPDALSSPVEVKYSKSVKNHTQNSSDASRHPENLFKQNTIRKSGARRNPKNFHPTIGSGIPKSGTDVNSTICETASFSSSGVTLSSDIEPEKVWHYKDPAGNVQGPFTLLQLSKWTSHFPRDLRVWLTFECEERSLLLTEVLSKQPKDFGETASVTTNSKATLGGSEQNRYRLNVDLNNAPSPVGFSMLNSSEITGQATEYSVPKGEIVNYLDDRLSLSTSSVPPKDTNTLNSQVQHQTHSGTPPSPGSPCGRSDLHHDGVLRRHTGEWNNHHSSGGLWSPTMQQTSCSGQSNLESQHNQHAMRSQIQHDSKNSLQASFVKDLNSRPEYSQNLPTQRILRDVPSPAFAWSPSESRTASSQHDGSCLSSSQHAGVHDELHSSVKAKSCAPPTPVEDRGSSSPSGMLSHSERVPVCSPQSAPACASEKCKMEEIMNEERTLEAGASNASANQSPQCKIFPGSSPENQDIELEHPRPALRSESKEPAVDCSGSPSVAPEICKMEIVNQQKAHDADGSYASVNQSPQSKICTESSHDNQDLERSYPSLTLRPESKDPTVEQSGSTSVAPEICKTETMNQEKTLEMDASNASFNQSPRSRISPGSSPDDQDTKHEYPSPVLRSDESKEPAMGHQGTTSVTPEISNMETMNQPRTLEAGMPIASVNQSPQSKIFLGFSHNSQDVEREYPIKTIRSESMELAVDQAGSPLVATEMFKVEITNQQKIHKADASNASVNHPPLSNFFPESSNNQDNECEYPSSILISESKEPALDHSWSKAAALQNVTTKVPDQSLVTFVSPNSGPLTGEVGATESLAGLEKIDLEGGNLSVQKELYTGSTVVTRDNMVVDLASCAESIDVLESLMEQSCETSYMDGTAALEDLLNASAEEEPQCSSPIALSPWGEPGYYQGDAVDSALWCGQDDPMNDMWSLSSPTRLQLSSGIDINEKIAACAVNEVTTQGNNEVVQRGSTPGEKKVELANSSTSSAWGFIEQVKSEANDAPVPSITWNMGVLGWQLSANESSGMDTAWSTGQSHNLSSSYETAAPSSRSSQEASRKQEFTYLNGANSGEVLGSAKNWNPYTGNANRGRQRGHHHDRYSQISESWLLSSNYSRSGGSGSGGSSRAVPRGQTQRGVCKFHESGYCRKGALCNYLHP